MTASPVRSGAHAPRRRLRARRRLRRVIPNVALICICVVWVFPIYWMLNTSFKPASDLLQATPKFVPIPFSLANYADALTKPGFVGSLVNSVIVTAGAIAISIALSFFAAAALARFVFIGRKTILIAIIVVQMIPSTALLIPLFLSFKSLGLLNSYAGVILAYVASVLPFSIWVLRSFFIALPVEIEEAAKCDGASTSRILRSIYFPLLLPGLVATSVFAFIQAWNDFIIAYVMLQDQSKYTLTVWLVSFQSHEGVDYGGLIAGSVLFSVPVVIFFLIVQRNLVSGMSAGAVKG